MKKLLVVCLTLVVAMGITACGGVDTTAAVDSFNATSARMDEIGELANPNAELLGDAFMDEMIALAEELVVLKSELESEDITQERADEIDAISKEYLTTMDGFEERIEEMLADPSLAHMQTIQEIVIELTNEYNEVATIAIENGWDYDDLTATELNALAGFLETAQTEAFYDELALLEEADIVAVLEECETLQGAMPELLERVSQPYTDEY